MKEIKNMEEYKIIDGRHPAIVKFGLPTCIPCKMTEENLTNYENEKLFNLDYYQCSNIDMMTELGYNSVPVVVLITPTRKVELTDSSISMDEDELKQWINENLK